MSTHSAQSPTRNRFQIARGSRVALALAALGAAALSCSVIIDTSSKQCSADADCAKLGGAFAGSVCQQNLCVAPMDPLVCKTIDAGANTTAKLTFTIGFATKPADLGVFTVLACDRLDVDCTSPVAGPAMEDPSDPTAQIELDVPIGFQGFLQVTNPSTVPSMEFLARPIQEDTAGWNLTIATEPTVTGLGLATQTKIDRTLGTFIVIARDCNRAPLAGVQTSLEVTQGSDPDAGPDTTVGFYLVNTFPTKSQMVTTSEGASGYVNVPLGSASLSGVIVDSGVALSPTSAVSRSGWISYVEVQP
jgi:hypothetical protein